MFYNKENLAEDHIKESIYRHPLLFGRTGRFGVLYHIFFVNGNGLEWVDGLVKNRYPSGPLPEPGDYAEFPAPGGGEFSSLNKAFEEYNNRKREFVKGVRLNVQDSFNIAPDQKMIKGHIGHKDSIKLAEYFMITSIPENVHPDWAKFIKEVFWWVEPFMVKDDLYYETLEKIERL